MSVDLKIGLLLIVLLMMTGCAHTCDHEENHKFLAKNTDFFTEVCYTIEGQPEVNGKYCLKRLK